VRAPRTAPRAPVPHGRWPRSHGDKVTTHPPQGQCPRMLQSSSEWRIWARSWPPHPLPPLLATLSHRCPAPASPSSLCHRLPPSCTVSPGFAGSSGDSLSPSPLSALAAPDPPQPSAKCGN